MRIQIRRIWPDVLLAMLSCECKYEPKLSDQDYYVSKWCVGESNQGDSYQIIAVGE